MNLIIRINYNLCEEAALGAQMEGGGFAEARVPAQARRPPAASWGSCLCTSRAQLVGTRVGSSSPLSG